MQSDVPPLPISCLINKIKYRRNNNFKSSLTTQGSTNNSPYKNKRSTLLLLKKKKLFSVIADDSPYSARFNPPDTGKSSNKSVIRQRIVSAKMLRIKQLQNQLADAHFHLNELSNENKLLKTIQKRQDTALKRYEGTNAELPRIIHSHHEDLRVLQTKFKKLKSQFKETNDTLKEKENELHSLQVQNKKLLQLSKDRQLGEREKLQMQVFDLNHRVNQQDEMIQTLKRKLALESKCLKHQLHTEMVKHKETQKQLQDAQIKLKNLEHLTQHKDKKPYQTNRVTFFNRDRSTTTSQSLINLNESKLEHLIKGSRRRRSESTSGQCLPVLNELTLFSRSQSQANQNSSEESSSVITETRMNFEQIRNFRLQKSPNLQRSTPFSTSKNSVRDSPIKESEWEETDFKEYQMKSDIIDLGIDKKTHELPKTLKEELCYPNLENGNKDSKSSISKANESLNVTNGLKSLHARSFISVSDDVHTSKTETANPSYLFAKENLINSVENVEETKYDNGSPVTRVSKDALKDNTDASIIYSKSNSENEIEIPIALNIDEDKSIAKPNIAEKSFEIEKQTNTSKLPNQLYETFDRSFDSNKDNDKIELNLNTDTNEVVMKSTNSSLIKSELRNNEKTVDNLLIQKHIIPTKMLTDDNIFKDSLKTNERNSMSNQIKNSNKETNSTNEEKILFGNKETSKESQNNANNFYSNPKTSHDNLEESDVKNKAEQKTVENSKAFDKAKLLAAMKAIDDSENIEFMDEIQKNSITSKIQLRDNLYKGIPISSRRKSDIMKELFTDTKLDNNKNVKGN